MATLEKEHFDRCMERIENRLDDLDIKVYRLSIKYEFMKDLEFIELKDLAHLLKISERTVYRISDEGALHYFTMNNKRFFWATEIAEYIKSHKTEER